MQILSIDEQNLGHEGEFEEPVDDKVRGHAKIM